MADNPEEAALARLLQLIGAYQAGQIDQAALGARIAEDAELRELARQRAGGRVERGGAVIDFGANTQLGDVHIRDAAGRDIINMTVNLAAQPARPARADDSKMAHTRALIAQHQRRLNVLELQAAQFGLYAPPHITLEIEDLQKKLAELRREIGE
jgi:hypothetical protein